MKSRKLMNRLHNLGLSPKSGFRRSRRVSHLATQTDLSYLEEQTDRSVFQDIGNKATSKAIKENKALGIPSTFWENGRVVRRMNDGTISPLSQTHTKYTNVVREGRRLKKGTVLHVTPRDK